MYVRFDLHRFMGPWVVVIALSGSLLAQGKGKGGGDDGGDPSPHPPVRYEVCFVKTPDGYFFEQELDLNNAGQLVGWLNAGDGVRRASLVQLSVDENGELQSQAIFLEDIVDTSLLPDGFWLETATGINDAGVVVGNATNAADDRLPYAIDLRCTHPVVDLLPDLDGATQGVRWINNAGDIVAHYYITPDSYSIWLLQLGDYYGIDSPDRPVDEDGKPAPLDFNSLQPVLLGDLLGPVNGGSYKLSERLVDGPAYVIGSLQTREPFRLAVDDTGTVDQFEVFSNLAISSAGSEIGGINSTGLWSAAGLIGTGKGKGDSGPFRYLDSAELLPSQSSLGYLSDQNELGAILFENGFVWDDWQDSNGDRYVNILELIDSGDLQSLSYFNEQFLSLLSDSRMMVGGSQRREKRFISEIGPKFFLVPRTVAP